MKMGRADLHVHSCYSTVSGNLRFLRSRDCYSSPLDVYRTAKRRGMDVVTITDHDAIDGWRELMDALPDADDILAGVFDVMALLRESGTFFALNHVLHFYRGQVPLERYLQLLSAVPAMETRNGAMLDAHNALAERLSREWKGGATPMACVAGSDAHTLRRVGRTWTEAPGTTAPAFLASLAAGLGKPGGDHGGPMTVAGDTYGVVARYSASVYGHGPRDHSGWHRAGCALFIAASIPAQFMPVVVAMVGKSRERRAVAAAAAQLVELAAKPLNATAWPESAAEPQS
jgi:hypothetical protein